MLDSIKLYLLVYLLYLSMYWDSSDKRSPLQKWKQAKRIAVEAGNAE